MFQELKQINTRPAPFEFYTAEDLWADPHTSQKMLEYHLKPDVDMSSRNKAFIDESKKWIIERFGLKKGSMVADFGCGPGLYTGPLAEQGANVTGIDFSPNSIRYAKQTAKQKGLDINYVCMNYLEFDTSDRFDLIVMIMCDFCALSPDQRKNMLIKFKELLKPGGAVLLDVYSLDSFSQRQEAAIYELNQLNGFWAPNDYYCFVNTFKYDQEKVMLDKYTIVEDTQVRVVYNWLQYFSPESLKQEFEENGFKIDSLYGNVAGKLLETGSPEIAVMAVK